MKNKVNIFVLSVLVLLVCTQLQAIIVTPTSGPYTVGQILNFSASSAAWDISFFNPRINFGDGTVDFNIRYSVSVPHQYKVAGTYNLILSGTVGPNSTPPPPELLTITIIDTRTISYTPMNPLVGQTVTFTANNFATPENIRWDFGDGVSINERQDKGTSRAPRQVTHTFNRSGRFTIKAYDWDGSDSVPISLAILIGEPARTITADILSPREDQPVQFTAHNFISSAIDWNLGDGTVVSDDGTLQHRFMSEGPLTVSALDRGYTHPAVTLKMTILPENRSIQAAPVITTLNQPVTLTAQAFRGSGVLWDFGDGTQVISGHQEVHIYPRPGQYKVIARDESGLSQRQFSTDVTVQRINLDEVSLHKAELRFDNGRAYRIVAKNSRHLQAELQLKMEGTGLITGIWMLDGQAFSHFSQIAHQGEVAVIRVGQMPPLPTLDAGLHRLSVRMTRPALDFLPEISYFVEPISAIIELIEPPNGRILKEDEIPRFSWTAVRGASYYEIGFADTLYTLLFSPSAVKWQTVREGSGMVPDTRIWTSIARNSWTFWQVRAKDSNGQLISQSEPAEIQVIMSPAQVTVTKTSDMAGRPIDLSKTGLPRQLMIEGTILYPGESKFLVLRVFADERMVNQLLFREVKPGVPLPFSTSVPGRGSQNITLQVLKVSSPAVIVGVYHLQLNR